MLKEVTLGHTMGPFRNPVLQLAGIPHWGHSQETLFRMAYYFPSLLLYPKHCPTSVNAHIPPESYSLQYIKVDHTIAILQDLGPDCFMSKLDIKSAFCNVPVHPSDWDFWV